MIPPTIVVEAHGLADAWGQLVKKVLRDGIVIETEYGPKSKDVCSVTTVLNPLGPVALHPQFPTKEQHLTEYIKQFGRDYDWKKQGFKYTYLDRLVNYPGHLEGWKSDQLEYLRTQLAKPTSRRAQAITWIPLEDIGNDEPPCLQRIWMRKLDGRTVEMHCDWRSRDLYSAWNSNYVAILNMINVEVLLPLGLKLVKLVDFCDSLHIYEADWEAAAKVTPLPVSPQMMR